MNSRLIIVAFHKPYGVLSTFTDESGRPTLKSYIPVPGVYAAGRLDMDSEGLLLLTNDGKLIHQLADPRFHQPKIYLVQVEGEITLQAMDQLHRGMRIQNYLTRPCQARIIPEPKLEERSKPPTPHGPTCWIEMTLTEGKKRQVRHMTAAVGFPTVRLVRVAIGPIKLGELSIGAWRYLEANEIRVLRNIGGDFKPDRIVENFAHK